MTWRVDIFLLKLHLVDILDLVCHPCWEGKKSTQVKSSLQSIKHAEHKPGQNVRPS